MIFKNKYFTIKANFVKIRSNDVGNYQKFKYRLSIFLQKVKKVNITNKIIYQNKFKRNGLKYSPQNQTVKIINYFSEQRRNNVYSNKQLIKFDQIIQSIQSIMQSIILKNKKQLHNSLPIPQLGSKYAKLVERFTNKSNIPSNKNLKKRNFSLSQHSSLNDQNKQKQQNIKFKENSRTTLQQTQLEYFKQINYQIKLENLNLKQELKICQEKVKKLSQDKLTNQQKLASYHKTVVKSQKKISSLMEFAQQLIVMVKDRYLDQQRISSAKLGSLKDGESLKSFSDSLEAKKMEMEKQMERIKQLAQIQTKRVSTIKKKTIETMMQQHKAQVQFEKKHLKKAKKSTFYQLSNYKSTNSLNHSIKDSQTQIKQQDNDKIEQKEQTQLLNSLKSIERDVKEIKVLKKIVQGIARNFNEETQTDSGVFKRDNNDDSLNNPNQIMDFVLEQIGDFFNNLVEKHPQHVNTKLSIDSLVVNQKIKPTYASQRLYKSIKEIFDHQICLLQSQKMYFLQSKNKRLLKFIYQCNGCERYQEMFAEIFRILRQGFKEIKWKILPQLKNKSQDQLQIIL